MKNKTELDEAKELLKQIKAVLKKFTKAKKGVEQRIQQLEDEVRKHLN
jgi:hypothetical protein